MAGLVTALVKLPAVDAQEGATSPIPLHYRIDLEAITPVNLEDEIGGNFVDTEPANNHLTAFRPNIVFIGAENVENAVVRYTVDGISTPSGETGDELGFIVPNLPNYVEIPVQGKLDLVQLCAGTEATAVQVIVQQ